MSLIKTDSFNSDQEMPEHFVRGMKARKSFRIRHRGNQKLPPAAIIYMKSLEKTNVNEINITDITSAKSKAPKSDKIRDVKVKAKHMSTEITEFDELECDESMHLLRRTSSIKKRNSFKKPSKKSKKLNKIINFFR